jgi:AmpE protein
MSFLAMILGVLLLQAFPSHVPLHRDKWFVDLCHWLGQYIQSPLWLTLGALVLPVLVLSWALDLLEPLLFGLFWVALATLVLLYSFGRGDYQGLLNQYRHDCLRGDFEAAYLALNEHLGDRSAPWSPMSPAEFQEQAQRVLLYEGYQRWFPVLLYFVLLGPLGALLYRLAKLNQGRTRDETDHMLVLILDWLPSRLLALTFAVTGDFVRTRNVLGGAVFGDERPDVLLYRVASAAVDAPVAAGQSHPGAAMARASGEYSELLSRSAAVWVAVLAVLALLI